MQISVCDQFLVLAIGRLTFYTSGQPETNGATRGLAVTVQQAFRPVLLISVGVKIQQAFRPLLLVLAYVEIHVSFAFWFYVVLVRGPTDYRPTEMS